MATAALTEPHVLAGAKAHLFPEDGTDAYAVVDTQFAQDRWIDDRRIDPDLQDLLAPFNHVQVGSGYPDLVGVPALENDLLAVDRVGDHPPLLAVEAKGRTATGTADVERGIVQAYDRLDEANVAMVAAPAGSIPQSALTLAREVNVGILAVAEDGTVTPEVRPRAVGARPTGEADAIRFQASAQGVADRNFGLNHPKNYLAYPLALVHEGDTEAVLAERVVGATDAARVGAAFLDLIEDRHDGPRLTPLGEEVVRFGLRAYGSVDAALDQFREWKRSQKRFCDLAPRWGQLTRRVVYQYPATQLLVDRLQRLADDGQPEPSLVELVEYCHETHPTFTVELFLRGTDDVRQRVLTAEGDLQRDALTDGVVYHSPTVFQLKTMLYHAGIVTETGVEPSTLDPEADAWALREPLSRFRSRSDN
ncbi:hypothetical protein [Halorientalis regularis]|uniref:Uncharacterized protein n=1 Tax=Halorientalis regularis TaxID=660518 RepID=A0A1G7JWJ3_9EURY|nr:hypothetical protein [Halorientalis regularis]SDF29231.1 hypothetical protein SAMN05216218_10584 [Halorientalis regularis]